MIKRLYVDNFKCLVNFELGLSELTLLVGDNGVGKTAVLDVVHSLVQWLSGLAKLPGRITDRAVFPTSTLTRWQQRHRQVFELGAVLDGDDYRYRLEIEHDPTNHRARMIEEKLEQSSGTLFHFLDGQVHLFRDDHSAGPVFPGDWSESALARVPPRQDNTRLSQFVEFIRQTIVCALVPALFITESTRDELNLSRDGANFASWYRHMLLERPDLVPEFITALKEIIPGLRGIRMEKIGQETRVFKLMFERFDSTFELGLGELSDGQRALIALHALVRLAAAPARVLFLDEPENYLALAEIQPWLMELKDACGGPLPQAVLCSHHPELLDYLGPDDGVLLEQGSNGVTSTRPLNALSPSNGGAPALRLSERIARGWLS